MGLLDGMACEKSGEWGRDQVGDQVGDHGRVDLGQLWPAHRYYAMQNSGGVVSLTPRDVDTMAECWDKLELILSKKGNSCELPLRVPADSCPVVLSLDGTSGPSGPSGSSGSSGPSGPIEQSVVDTEATVHLQYKAGTGVLTRIVLGGRWAYYNFVLLRDTKLSLSPVGLFHSRSFSGEADPDSSSSSTGTDGPDGPGGPGGLSGLSGPSGQFGTGGSSGGSGQGRGYRPQMFCNSLGDTVIIQAKRCFLKVFWAPVLGSGRHMQIVKILCWSR